MKSSFSSWEQRRKFGLLPAKFKYKALNRMILQQTKIIPLLDMVYLLGLLLLLCSLYFSGPVIEFGNMVDKAATS
jgi:hypothetical protein